MSETRCPCPRGSPSPVGNQQCGVRGRSGSAVTPLVLLKEHALPLAAHLHSSAAPPSLDTSQPLLLYKSYNAKKISAASLQVNKEKGLLAAGPTLVIPESYSGWFSIITGKGRSAPYHATIEEVAKAKPPFFLTRYEISAYIKHTDPSECDRVSYRKVTVQGGAVLKLLGIFEDFNTRRLSGENGHNRRKYIQCLNHLNEVVFISFTVSGRFFETAQRGSTSLNQVFLISQIINSFSLPLNVRLICGFMPRVPPAFTGILRLEQIENGSVVLACTITSEAKATLMEMDVDSNFLLQPILDPLYKKTPVFLKSVSYCDDEAESWQRQIKIIHHVTERVGDSSLKRYTNSSTVPSGSTEGKFLFFGNLDSLRGRTRLETPKGEKLKFSKFRDKSKDTRRSGETGKENRQKEGEESRFKSKMIDKWQDITRNRHCVANGEFIAIRPTDQLSGKKQCEDRKVCKQNTYIFQNDKFFKQQDKRRTPSETESTSTTKLMENQDYATVFDDISHLKVDNAKVARDTLYAEIGDYETAFAKVMCK